MTNMTWLWIFSKNNQYCIWRTLFFTLKPNRKKNGIKWKTIFQWKINEKAIFFFTFWIRSKMQESVLIPSYVMYKYICVCHVIFLTQISSWHIINTIYFCFVFLSKIYYNIEMIFIPQTLSRISAATQLMKRDVIYCDHVTQLLHVLKSKIIIQRSCNPNCTR